MATSTIDIEVCLKWSRNLKDNIFPALSWLAEVQWINDRLCPECNGIDPLAAPDECMGPDEAGHESGCRLAAMMRIFGVIPDMIAAGQETET